MIRALEEALSCYTSRAAEKLRAEGLEASVLQVFVTTRVHARAPYHGSAAAALPYPTAARACLGRAYKRGCLCKKGGVVLLELVPEAVEQRQLFEGPRRNEALMRAVDAINRRYGRGDDVLRSEPGRPALADEAGAALAALYHAEGGDAGGTCPSGVR